MQDLVICKKKIILKDLENELIDARLSDLQNKYNIILKDLKMIDSSTFKRSTKNKTN
jgi:hypothetical protein